MGFCCIATDPRPAAIAKRACSGVSPQGGTMRHLIVILLAVVLAGCGGPEADAIAACKAEIAVKSGDKNYALDEADMAAKATREGEDVIRIESTIVFDPGMPREMKQTFDCRVRMSGETPTVIALSFIW
jgi:hypothetical protein